MSTVGTAPSEGACRVLRSRTVPIATPVSSTVAASTTTPALATTIFVNAALRLQRRREDELAIQTSKIHFDIGFWSKSTLLCYAISSLLGEQVPEAEISQWRVMLHFRTPSAPEGSEARIELSDGKSIAQQLIENGGIPANSRVHVGMHVCPISPGRQKGDSFVQTFPVGSCIKPTKTHQHLVVPPDIADLFRLVTAEKRKPTLLCGHRGGGRTTSAQLLLKCLRERGYQPANLTFPTKITSLICLWNQLGQDLRRQINYKDTGRPLPSTPKKFVEELAHTGLPIAVVIDDFDRIADAEYVSPVVKTCVLAQIRQFIEILDAEMPGNVASVVFVGTPATQACAAFESVAFVKDFSLTDVQQLLEQYCFDRTVCGVAKHVDRAIASTIFDETGGRPSLVMHLLEILDSIPTLQQESNVTHGLWGKYMMYASFHVYGSVKNALHSLPVKALKQLKAAMLVDGVEDLNAVLHSCEAQYVKAFLANSFIEKTGGDGSDGKRVSYNPAARAMRETLLTFIATKLAEPIIGKVPVLSDGIMDLSAVVKRVLRALHLDGREILYAKKISTAGSSLGESVPNESIYHMEFYRLLVQWLYREGYLIESEVKCESACGKLMYIDLLIISPNRTHKHVIELSASIDKASAVEHFDRVSKYRVTMGAMRAANIVFTCANEEQLRNTSDLGWKTIDNHLQVVEQLHVLHSPTWKACRILTYNHYARKVADISESVLTG